MRTRDIWSLLAAIVGVAALTAFFSGKYTSAVIGATGNAFQSGLRASMGHAIPAPKK